MALSCQSGEHDGMWLFPYLNWQIVWAASHPKTGWSKTSLRASENAESESEMHECHSYYCSPHLSSEVCDHESHIQMLHREESKQTWAAAGFWSAIIPFYWCWPRFLPVGGQIGRRNQSCSASMKRHRDAQVRPDLIRLQHQLLQLLGQCLDTRCQAVERLFQSE